MMQLRNVKAPGCEPMGFQHALFPLCSGSGEAPPQLPQIRSSAVLKYFDCDGAIRPQRTKSRDAIELARPAKNRSGGDSRRNRQVVSEPRATPQAACESFRAIISVELGFCCIDVPANGFESRARNSTWNAQHRRLVARTCWPCFSSLPCSYLRMFLDTKFSRILAHALRVDCGVTDTCQGGQPVVRHCHYDEPEPISN
jgi:hypothetical protein